MTSPGSVWVIGDVQGCHAPLQQLLSHPQIAQDANARIWFAGDLINRGPDSLGAIRTVMQLGDRAVTVLGNHDLHLLGVVAGARKAGKSDTLQDILQAPDADEIIDWLRHRPLAHFDRGHLLVHAGILPQWTVAQTLSLASEVESVLQGPDWRTYLHSMYGNEPCQWRDDLTGPARMRVIINALTRLRMCTADGTMDFKHKDEPGQGGDLLPWFDVPGRAAAGDTIVFGHWSTLGLMLRPDVICLDTGCVWGRQLTALRLGDRECVQVACRQYKDPLRH